MKIRAVTLILAFGLLSLAAEAQSIRKYSNEFLKIGVGARAAAMGNSMSGIVQDVTSGYWNPAGLNHMSADPELALMHSEYFAGIAKFDYGGFAMAIDNDRHFGLSVIRLGVDDIANTLNLVDQNGNINFDNVESFSVADLAVILSFAQKLKFLEGLSAGANVKLVNRSVGKFANAWGFGLDLGLQYQVKNVELGLMISDVTGTYNAWSFNTETFQDAFVQTGNVIPENSLEITLPAMRLGAGYKFFRDRKVEVLGSFDTDLHFDGKRNVLANLGGMSIDPHMGVEVGYKQMVFLRGGFRNLQRVPNDKGDMVWSIFPTVGAGFYFRNLTVDYALANVGDFSQTLYSHVFSLKYTFKGLKIGGNR